MSLLELKSDLSKFRKPLSTTPIVKQNREINKSFSTTPLEKMVLPTIKNIPSSSKLKASPNLQNISLPSGRHTKGIDIVKPNSIVTDNFKGSELKITSLPTGHHESSNVKISKDIKFIDFTKDMSNLNLDKILLANPRGRHESKTIEIKNISKISGRHAAGTDVKNTTEISGRHLKDDSNLNVDKIILSNPSGRHANGKDVTNSSQLSGRHNQDNSNLNPDTTVLTNPSGRHNIGKEITNSSQISGRHLIDNSNLNADTVILSNPSGRHLQSGNGLPQYASPKEVNFFSDTHAIGFTSKFAPGDPTKYNVNSSKLNEYGNLKIVNFISDTDASGFTKNMQSTAFVKDSIDKQLLKFPENFKFIKNQTTTNFIGIDNGQFTYPDTIKGGRMWRVGNKSYNAQLGLGTFVPNASSIVGHEVKMSLTGTGYNDKRKYSDVTQNKTSPLSFQYQAENSPSLLDLLYKKYPLQDSSTNYSYIKHPLIVRGIQRNGKPERWGIEQTFGFDDGFIRGGTLAATERSAVDTLRISKWLASPKGLLWIAREHGLQLMNPKVETITGTGSDRLTRIFNPASVPLNTAGNAFGIHVERHGLPLANEAVKYEAVQNQKKILDIGTGGAKSNRLVMLKNELLNTNVNTGFGGLLGFIDAVKSVLGYSGTPIITLSGLAGPNSAGGIGATIHRRYIDSREGIKQFSVASLKAKLKPNSVIGNAYYTIMNQYASALAISSTTKSDDEAKRSRRDVDIRGLFGAMTETIDNHPFGELSENYPFSDQPTDKNPIATANDAKSLTNKDRNPIKKYATLAYGKLSREPNKSIQNFQELDDSLKQKNGKEINKTGLNDYNNTNLDSTYGYGNHGKVGADRTDYTKPSIGYSDKRISSIQNPDDSNHLFRGDKINLIDAAIANKSNPDNVKRFEEIYKIIKSDSKPQKDFINFYFSGPKNIANTAEEVLVFRASITNYQDQFNPQWNSYSMLGRADKVHIYESWARSISFNFKVIATSRDELRPIWRKLNYLSSWTAPKYSGDRFQNPMIRLTLGNLFQQTPCFINSLVYSVDDNIPWEINLEEDEKMMQVPHGVDAAISLTMIMDYRPGWNSRNYSLSDKGIHLNDEKNWLYDASNAYSSENGESNDETPEIIGSGESI